MKNRIWKTCFVAKVFKLVLLLNLQKWKYEVELILGDKKMSFSSHFVVFSQLPNRANGKVIYIISLIRVLIFFIVLLDLELCVAGGNANSSAAVT